MDYPVNRDTALAVEKAVKDNGAVPATIAIIEGIIHIGLSASDIEFLA
jgi:pseudouridylate synthase